MKAARQPSQEEKDLAAAYRRLFTGSEDGKRVYADLLTQFNPDKPRFLSPGGQFVAEPYAAAFTDGQLYMTARIRALVEGGSVFRHTEPIPPA